MSGESALYADHAPDPRTYRLIRLHLPMPPGFAQDVLQFFQAVQPGPARGNCRTKKVTQGGSG